MSKTKHTRSNSIVTKKSVSDALRPPSWELREMVTGEYAHKMKSIYRSVLEELRRKRLVLYRDYDTKTYVCENRPLFYVDELLYEELGYELIKEEADNSCEHMFCGATCSRNTISPSYYWVKGDHKVSVQFIEYNHR